MFKCYSLRWNSDCGVTHFVWKVTVDNSFVFCDKFKNVKKLWKPYYSSYMWLNI